MGYCIDCIYHSYEKKNVTFWLQESPVNLKSITFINLVKDDIRKQIKNGVLCCNHINNVVTDFTTGNKFVQPCSAFNSSGQCINYDDGTTNNSPDTPIEDSPDAPAEETSDDIQSGDESV